MTRSLGFGAERLGHLTLARPRAALTGVVALTLICLAALPRLSFEADMLQLADSDSPYMQDLRTLREEAPGALPELYILARAPRAPPPAEWMTRLGDLQFDLQLADGVAAVQSPFSVREADGQGGTRPAIDLLSGPPPAGDLPARVAETPLLRAYLDPEGGAALLTVALEEDAAPADVLAETRRLAGDYGIEVAISGQAAAQAEVDETLRRDLRRMIALSILVGWLAGVAIFSDLRAVVVINVVAPLAMLWTAGAYAALGATLDPATVILPILAAVLSFADAVHIVVPLQRRLQEGAALRPALSEVMARIGPATALTSMTTALAFGSLVVAGDSLRDMAMMGAGAAFLAWLSVMTVCPLLCLALGRRGLGATRIAPEGGLAQFRGLAARAIAHRRAVVGGTLLLCAGFALMQAQAPPRHDPADYVATDSRVLSAERALDASFGGSSLLLVRVPLPAPGGPAAPANRARLQDWEEAVARAAPEGRVWSEADLAPEVAAALAARQGAGAGDRDTALIAVRHGWSAPDADLDALVSRIEASLAVRPGGAEARVAGLSYAAARSAEDNIRRLRGGLFVSVLLAAGLVAVATRSAGAAAATGLSVLVSVLAVLALGSALTGAVEYGLVVALVISVGIAIDNGTHVVNYARWSGGATPAEAYAAAVGRAGMAIVISTVVLVASLSVTQIAAMPSVRAMGREVVLALLVALGTALTVMPAAAVAAEGLGRRARGRRP